MSDPAFVAAAYAIVLGGLSLYVISIARRVQSARQHGVAVQPLGDGIVEVFLLQRIHLLTLMGI